MGGGARMAEVGLRNTVLQCYRGIDIQFCSSNGMEKYTFSILLTIYYSVLGTPNFDFRCPTIPLVRGMIRNV